jgi:hypothetical protein
MNQFFKGKAKFALPWLSALLLYNITLFGGTYDVTLPNFHSYLTADTLPEKPAAPLRDLPVADLEQPKNKLIDTGKAPRNAVDTNTLPVVNTMVFRKSTDSLSAPVSYQAEDSMVLDVPGKKMLLYGTESNVKYLDNDLSAPLIEYDQQSSLVKAVLKKDSTGAVIAYPTYTQTDFKSISDTIVFNMKTGKGLTKGTYTQQGEMYVYGEKIKKIDESVFYALNGRFTSCNLDTPHFAFVSKKVKLINKKMAFTGPVHPEVEGVPLPIVLPFGIYPLIQGRHSGFLAPSFTANEQFGIGLEGLGYYKILSDNWDLITRGTLYSYGGWTLTINPRYFKKYRYQGTFNLNLLKTKVGFKGDPDYSSNNAFNIQWSHGTDSKARPGVSFRANVNAGSSRYNEQLPNSPIRNFTNQLSSSITYSKTWKDRPYNFSVSANHNQNTLNRLINLNLPDIVFNLNTIYPFRKKNAIGDLKWYENIGIALNTNVRSLTSFYDTAGNIGNQIADNLQWGASHSIPITLSLPSLGPVQVSPSVSYQEHWYDKQVTRSWDPVNRKLDTTTRNGLFTARDMNFGLGLTTRIFGSFAFGRKSRVQAIRHEIRPSISLNYKPNFNAGSYYNTQIDTLGNVVRESYYSRSIYGPFSETRFAGLSFSIDNVLQMKVRDKKDTSAALKKVSLLDGLSIGSNYNFLVDSFNFGFININARSNLFDKFSITANAQFDPYQYNDVGKRIDKLVWADKPLSLGTLLSGGISLQSQFTGGNGERSPTSAAYQQTLNQTRLDPNGMPLEEYQQEAAYMQNNPGEFVDFNIPWSIDFSYSLRFARVADFSNPGRFITTTNQDITWNSSANLSPKWKIGIAGAYNITAKEVGVISMFLSRDLHCWQLAINISPVGRYRFFSINISPKSALLRDLKVNRTRSFYEF